MVLSWVILSRSTDDSLAMMSKSAVSTSSILVSPDRQQVTMLVM